LLAHRPRSCPADSLMQLLRLPLSVTSGECRQGRRGNSGGETPIPPWEGRARMARQPGVSPPLLEHGRRSQAWLSRPREASRHNRVGKAGRAASQIAHHVPVFPVSRRSSDGRHRLDGLFMLLHAKSHGAITQFALAARVPVNSVCPCSKAISDYGAQTSEASSLLARSPVGTRTGNSPWYGSRS
jgi:hypothetical protein